MFEIKVGLWLAIRIALSQAGLAGSGQPARLPVEINLTAQQVEFSQALTQLGYTKTLVDYEFTRVNRTWQWWRWLAPGGNQLIDEMEFVVSNVRPGRVTDKLIVLAHWARQAGGQWQFLGWTVLITLQHHSHIIVRNRPVIGRHRLEAAKQAFIYMQAWSSYRHQAGKKPLDIPESINQLLWDFFQNN